MYWQDLLNLPQKKHYTLYLPESYLHKPIFFMFIKVWILLIESNSLPYPTIHISQTKICAYFIEFLQERRSPLIFGNDFGYFLNVSNDRF